MKAGRLYTTKYNIAFNGYDFYYLDTHIIPKQSIVLLLTCELCDGKFVTVHKNMKDGKHIFIKVLYNNMILERCIHPYFDPNIPYGKMIEEYFCKYFERLE